MDSKEHSELMSRLMEQAANADDLTIVVLKGHLVLEEILVRIIGKFVHHADHIPDRLNFANRVGLARSMSLDEADNSMWNLVLLVNQLRNKLSHSLDSPKRRSAFDKLKEAYNLETADTPSNLIEPRFVALAAIAHCLGFLSSFESEVDRFREALSGMDKIYNPHRHDAG